MNHCTSLNESSSYSLSSSYMDTPSHDSDGWSSEARSRANTYSCSDDELEIITRQILADSPSKPAIENVLKSKKIEEVKQPSTTSIKPPVPNSKENKKVTSTQDQSATIEKTKQVAALEKTKTTKKTVKTKEVVKNPSAPKIPSKNRKNVSRVKKVKKTAKMEGVAKQL